MRVGIGYDAHRFTDGRPLVLGGVRVPFSKGLAGHSDADVLVHAIGDAFLGAIAAGDIGKLFPDHDIRYKDISSIKLLKHIHAIVKAREFCCINIDATIVAQRPRLSKYVSIMEKNITRCLDLKKGDVNIKATTTEGMGPEGRLEGISAYAVVLVEKASML